MKCPNCGEDMEEVEEQVPLGLDNDIDWICPNCGYEDQR